MVLIITSPLRSAWASDGPATLRRLLPAVIGLSGATSLVLLFLQYGNALAWTADDIVGVLSDPYGHSAVQLVSAIAITNAVLLAPLLLLTRRWSPPPGSATIVYALAAGLAGAITGFENASVVAATIVAGVAVDALLYWLRPGPGSRPAVFAFGGLAPLVTWILYLAFASFTVGQLPDVVEFWTGIPFVCAGLGLLLTTLAAPAPVRARD
jgi:hypothetical protein